MTFTQIITRLKEAYTKAYNAIDEEFKRNKNALLIHKENMKQYNSKTIAKENEAIKAEHEKNLKNISLTLNEEKETLKKEFENELKNIYMPAGESIVEKDVLLLNSGIALTSEEVEELARKHANNTTMLRIIETYAKRHKFKFDNEIKDLFIKANTSGANEIEAFKEFEFVADRGMGLMMYSATSSDVLEKSLKNLEKYSAKLLEVLSSHEAGGNNNV